MAQGDASKAYYYNVKSGEVEHGFVSDWDDRIGPFDTASEAAAALARVKARNEAADAQDKQWQDDPDE